MVEGKREGGKELEGIKRDGGAGIPILRLYKSKSQHNTVLELGSSRPVLLVPCRHVSGVERLGLKRNGVPKSPKMQGSRRECPHITHSVYPQSFNKVAFSRTWKGLGFLEINSSFLPPPLLYASRMTMHILMHSPRTCLSTLHWLIMTKL